MKKTEWFSADIKPDCVGVYEVDRSYADGTRMLKHKLFWTGKHWQYVEPFEGSSKEDFASMMDGDRWKLRTKELE